MGIPQSETDIKSLLRLDEFATKHPAPPEGSKREQVIELEGITYTKAAVEAALQATDDETIKDLLQYPKEILAHNNIYGHGGAGSNMGIERAILYCASRETRERVMGIQGKPVIA
jgi:hypothetical protein